MTWEQVWMRRRGMQEIPSELAMLYNFIWVVALISLFWNFIIYTKLYTDESKFNFFASGFREIYRSWVLGKLSHFQRNYIVLQVDERLF